MYRRCSGDECIIKVENMSRIHDICSPIATILYNPKREWNAISYGKIKIARSINVDWKKYSQDKYLFVHSTIVSSVAVADNGYYVEPPCDELINDNGNGWSTQILLSTFRSFIGKPNYLEHMQNPLLSKGTIVDAVARDVKYKSTTGKIANVVYIDILVAVDRKHSVLINQILSGEYNAMSMGCYSNWVTCTKCGQQFNDTMNSCIHLENELLKYFVDENGIERIVAELCGRLIKGNNGKLEADPDSNEFIEASWVENPAFKGAVINHYISEDKEYSKILNMADYKLQSVVDDIFNIRVADVKGMIVLRVACEELRRRNYEKMIEKVSKSLY